MATANRLPDHHTIDYRLTVVEKLLAGGQGDDSIHTRLRLQEAVCQRLVTDNCRRARRCLQVLVWGIVLVVFLVSALLWRHDAQMQTLENRIQIFEHERGLLK